MRKHRRQDSGRGRRSRACGRAHAAPHRRAEDYFLVSLCVVQRVAQEAQRGGGGGARGDAGEGQRRLGGQQAPHAHRAQRRALHAQPERRARPLQHLVLLAALPALQHARARRPLVLV